ncbi:MAG TPA: 16S rRNA (guanine(966)-N(2))-methyltransferase RsmD [Candidatus Saccharimonadales bacterium]|nr:16S rRNA (guanine(966)-N(2))-methyltransferase RsmD [Candidatus Saccharimonadales bacterium]
MRLRIVAGEFGGRQIEAPSGFTTHPMSERVRNALFNSLGDISGKSILDPFAGSGAISIEAVSRGAAHAVAIEKDRKAQTVIANNLADLGLTSRVKLIRANCRAWSETSQDQKFDIIIADPPYNDVNLSTINLLARHLKSTGSMLLSHSGRESAPTVNGVVVVDKRSYGDAALAIYRKEA